jgi:hypothetical protein
MKSTDILSPKQSLTTLHALFLGGLIAGTLDAVDGVIAFGTQGLNPIQVLQYIASGALGQAAFRGGLATAALGALFHFIIAWVAAGVFVFASRWMAVLNAIEVDHTPLASAPERVVHIITDAVDAVLHAGPPNLLRIGEHS